MPWSLSFAPEGLAERTLPELDRCLQGGIDQARLYTAATCVASVAGRLMHRGAYGHLRPPPPPQPTQPDTVFDLAGLTMPLVCGALAVSWWSRKRLDIEAPVATFLKDFRHPPFDRISLIMLLDHSSGLPARAPLEVGAPAPGSAEAVAHVRAGLGRVRPLAPPGEQVVESDLGFMLLGWILEAVGKKPLDQLALEQIFRPLNLQRELFFVRPNRPLPAGPAAGRRFAATGICPRRERRLQGEVADPLAAALGGVAGHAGLFGTAAAVWHLGQTFLSGHRGAETFFHTGSMARFWARSQRPRRSLRTLGWACPSAADSPAGTRLSRLAVGHLGATGTSIWIDPIQETVGVLLTNAAYHGAAGPDAPLRRLRARAYDLIGAEAALGPAGLEDELADIVAE